MTEPRKTPVSVGDPTGAARKKRVRKTRARVREMQPAAVAERAYFLSLSETGASPEENWLRAEQELLAS
jgi:hypothetical protein